MPFDKKAYMKEYRKKNKAYYQEKMKEWTDNNKAYIKEYREKHPRVEYFKEWGQTENGIKSRQCSNWRQIGIRCNGEWEEVYDWYSETTNCDICDKLFKESTDKCLDHNHDIDGYNIRGILCSKCNHYTNEI